ncbi:MAG: UDP-4-amino-4,6-dideoxy-N-acetyl-beta-L-altrosamine transaminase [Synergistaceae bacterium]|jgi:UDP-4-amino-4,6-dideoxy-N-acetyl-beta-L-altrosamine transaminase|nr:UDP-4-amino-4,6-dideoxy-N-acetyl-beta-L-altrosamine transaminase [Synergistaceae bacterium]
MKSLAYGKQWINEEDIDAVMEALRGDWLTQGPMVERFENALADYLGVKHVVVFSSGTAALHGAVAAAGLRPGDRLLTTPLTFVATANVALYVGAEPVFADIDRGTLCMDPRKTDQRLSELPRNVRAIVPVSFAGYPFEIESFRAMARENDAILIEDACHSLGGDREDHRIGFDADMTALSFHPVKHITTCEGGAVATGYTELDRRLRLFRNHGVTRSPDQFKNVPDGPWHSEMQMLGFNYRLSDVHCALGLSQMKRLDFFVARRRELSSLYRGLLAGLDGVYQPPAAEGHACHLFPLQVAPEVRGALFTHLAEHDIRAQVHYPPVPMHPYYKNRFGYRPGDFPEAESFYASAISLPLYPLMDDEDVERVVDCIRDFFKKR